MVLRHIKANQGIIRDYFSVISGSAGRLVISLAYFVALANTLTIAEFGLFATASATGVMLSRLVSFGFVSPLYRVATVKPHLIGAYTGGFLAAVVLSLPFFLAAAFLAHLIFFGSSLPLATFAVIVGAEALLWRSLEVVVIVNNGLNRFGRAAILVVIGTALRAIAAVLFAFSWVTSLEAWSWWYAGANGIALLIAIIYFYPRVRLRLVPRIYNRRLADSFAVAGAEVLFYVQSELDKLLVLAIGGPQTAGVYSIIMRLVDLTALPIRSFNMMLVQKLMRTPDMLRSLTTRIGLEAGVFLVSAIGLGGLALFLHLFPRALGGNVASVVALLPLVLLVPGFRNLLEYQAEILYARGQSGIRAVNLAVLGVAKAGLLYLLLTRMPGVDDWLVWLNAVFAALYLLSAILTYRAIRRPARRV
ncbi:lipopolysaccharide biosynthesis protein [Phyllobacterium sp. 0TCS1.6C]|uniref:lipopolysaccharide biosynthesis protein n=1 Tax=unclassified Phyllobacterium TaxID=2638441 RepID=UPI0022648BA9|nr:MULTISPECIES: lipopolysaccharide biosynthesis protein [unclassified Phyllobacterium]MCX8281999.1 lipopolysaccharide biosynthesis protein [Phyllobacterium sp. 0TCS1.6C]MCX8294462.1 lipopolysaccharide biosynthesis protein [Phyllobacterium sp. 0TCS1.6A]